VESHYFSVIIGGTTAQTSPVRCTGEITASLTRICDNEVSDPLPARDNRMWSHSDCIVVSHLTQRNHKRTQGYVELQLGTPSSTSDNSVVGLTPPQAKECMFWLRIFQYTITAIGDRSKCNVQIARSLCRQLAVVD
jgi:hypothetical protein